MLRAGFSSGAALDAAEVCVACALMQSSTCVPSILLSSCLTFESLDKCVLRTVKF